MGAGLGWSWVVGSGGLGCCLLVVSEGASLGGSSVCCSEVRVKSSISDGQTSSL